MFKQILNYFYTNKENVTKETNVAKEKQVNNLYRNPYGYEARLNVLFMGDHNVGKTTMLLMTARNPNFVSDGFIDADYYKNFTLFGIFTLLENSKKDTKTFKFFLQTRNKQGQKSILCTWYMRSITTYIVMYDVTNRETFINLSYYLDDIQNYGSIDATVMLVGNKIGDASNQLVASNEGKELANKYNALFCELNAKSETDISDFLEEIIKQRMINILKESKIKRVIGYKPT